MNLIDDRNDMLMWQSSRLKPVALSSIYVEQDANRESFSLFLLLTLIRIQMTITKKPETRENDVKEICRFM